MPTTRNMVVKYSGKAVTTKPVSIPNLAAIAKNQENLKTTSTALLHASHLKPLLRGATGSPEEEKVGRKKAGDDQSSKPGLEFPALTVTVLPTSPSLPSVRPTHYCVSHQVDLYSKEDTQNSYTDMDVHDCNQTKTMVDQSLETSNRKVSSWLVGEEGSKGQWEQESLHLGSAASSTNSFHTCNRSYNSSSSFKPPSTPLAAVSLPNSSPAAVSLPLSSPAAVSSRLPGTYRGPKVHSDWPAEQQIRVGPIPMEVSWSQIRDAFGAQVGKNKIKHCYVQSRAVEGVVYGQVVLATASLVSKVIQDGKIKVADISALLSLTDVYNSR